MSDLFTNPRFLWLAMKAQVSFSKASRMNSEDALEGKFCVHDMLDMLGAEIDRMENTDDRA